MANRILTCPRSKQISGAKGWFGFDGFAFPGWVDTWDTGALLWITAGMSTRNFVAGDLLLRKRPSGAFGPGPTTYPDLFFAYICTAAVTGAGDPAGDGTHFAVWDFTVNNAGGNRQTWDDPTHKFLEITYTTEFSNFPFGENWVSNSEDTPFTPTAADTLAGHLIAAADGTFTDDYTCPSHYNSTPVHTPPSGASADQTPFLYPVVPPLLSFSGGSAGTQFVHASASTYSPLISWSFTATSLQFVFFAGGSYGTNVFPPIATITQTISVTTEYLLTDAQAEAAALLSGTTFDALNWNQKAVCAYNSDGTIAVAVSAISGASPFGTVCASGVPAAPNVNAATAIGFNQGGLSLNKALVDVCGKYHINTFDCQAGMITVGDCETVDGFSPVEIDPPSSGGNPVFSVLFPGC